MKKYTDKKEIKSRNFFSTRFNIFSYIIDFDKIEKSFKSIVMSFQGKSKKQIEQHFKVEQLKSEMALKDEARRQLEKS